MRNAFFLIVFGLIFAVPVFSYGGVTAREWSYCLASLTVASLLLWLTGPVAKLAPALRPGLLWPLLAAPAWVVVQLIPLPPAWVHAISPARAELAAALLKITPGGSASPWTTLSVSPPVTFTHFLRLLAYILVFLYARELTWRLGRRRWLAAAPFLVVAVLEATLGLAQYYGGTGPATGTYVNQNHLAGLLELTLPFAVMLTASRIGTSNLSAADLPLAGTADSGSVGRALAICALLLCAATLFLGIVYSLSRMGLAASVASVAILMLLGAMRAKAGTNRTVFCALTPVLVFVLLAFALPERLLNRFSETGGQPGADREITTEARIGFWKETTHLIADYPATGTGLGTYVSSIQKYRASLPLSLLDFAHNDYLQLLAELGVIGFVPAALAAAFFLWRVFQTTVNAGLSPADHYLAMACAASLIAITLHATVDFNFYIPSNAMLTAWVAGIAGALEFAPDQLATDRRRHRRIRPDLVIRA